VNLKDTKQCTTNSKHLPGLNEANTDCNSAPAYDDEREPIGSANYTEQEIGWKFEQEITQMSKCNQEGNTLGRRQAAQYCKSCFQSFPILRPYQQLWQRRY